MRIFIVGSPRSGTTLLQSLLACHPLVTSFTESHFFTKHYRLFKASGTSVLVRDPVPRMQEFALENGLQPEHFTIPVRIRPALPFQTAVAARRFIQYLDRAASCRAAPVWVEKTPGHLWFIKRIEKSGFDSIRFVHILRDGPDVVTSMLRASRDWGARNPTIEGCSARWNHDLALTGQRLRAGRDVLINYNQLTTDTFDTMTALCTALGLEWDARWADRREETVAGIIAPAETWKANTSRAIAARSTFADSWALDQQLSIRASLNEVEYREVLTHALR